MFDRQFGKFQIKKGCQEIIHEFEQNRQTFYTKTDLMNDLASFSG